METVVFVAPNEDTADDEGIEIPLEEDGTASLKVVQTQFSNAVGLKFRAPDTGRMRALKLDEEGKLYAPKGGWNNLTYLIVTDKKRTREEEGGKVESESKKQYSAERLGDLIILGLNYKATEDDVRSYFDSYGEIKSCEIKKDYSGNSRGFGFISFVNDDSAKQVMTETYHTVAGRKCEVRIPKRTEPERKLFVGRLPRGTNEEDISEYFSKFGALADVYIPRPHRGFAFVTFEKGDDAETVLKQKHFMKDSPLNVTIPDPPAKKQKFGAEGEGYGETGRNAAPPKSFGGYRNESSSYYSSPFGQQQGGFGYSGQQSGYSGAHGNQSFQPSNQGQAMQVEDPPRSGIDINESELEFLDAIVKKVKKGRKSNTPHSQNWN